MRLIDTQYLDVYFHLAAESYFLHSSEESVLMLWRSENAVVCGKHQNICAEINVGYCKDNGILPARRISGGGTVFHDLGNVNFTFIQPLKYGLEKAVNYKQFLEPVRWVLAEMGIETEYSIRHDLLYGVNKISGNAQHIYQQGKRVLHHGTLLFNANIGALGDALHASGSYIDRAVKSNRSSVTNLGDHFPKYQNMELVLHDLWKGFERYYEGIVGVLAPEEMIQIQAIRDEKFNQDSWIYGYSPNFQSKKNVDTPDLGRIEWHWEVQKGNICWVTVLNSQGQEILISETQKLIGKPYWSNDVREILSAYSLSKDMYFYRLF